MAFFLITVILVVIGAFFLDWSKQRTKVSKEGGMILKYKTLVELLLSMRLMKLISHDNDVIVFGYSGPGTYQKLIILQTFSTVTITFEYRDDIFTKKLEWKFPENGDQEVMADKIANDISLIFEKAALLHGLSPEVSSVEFDSYKQQNKVIRIHGSQGKETSFEFCPILAGMFSMGSNEVKIDQDFYLGKYPVTQQQWEVVMGNNPSEFKGGSLPVETVSWDDAQTFIQKLNTLSGKKLYRLPTETEWEYACRAGSKLAYYYGDDESQLGEYAWYDRNSGQTTHPVGQKKPNGWGLYDMAGNVFEWTDSNWSGSSDRAVRGGGWSADYWYCRSAQSAGASPEHLGSSNGFRLVLDQTLKDEDRCSQTFPVDSPTELLLQDTLKHGLAPESYKQQDKVIRIHGSQGKETSFEFCPIPAGTINLGSNEIKIDRDFYLGKYPVTQQQWEAVMGNNPSRFKGGSLPVETVSFDDAQLFIQKLNQLSGKKLYRLPTEEEWEYACRAGTITEYYFGDDASQLGEYAWYGGNSGQTTHPVGQKKPNEWGLYDMAGNVFEWTDSWYDSSRSFRVLRGGSWDNIAVICRSAYRCDFPPDYRHYRVGFRLVLDQSLKRGAEFDGFKQQSKVMSITRDFGKVVFEKEVVSSYPSETSVNIMLRQPVTTWYGSSNSIKDSLFSVDKGTPVVSSRTIILRIPFSDSAVPEGAGSFAERRALTIQQKVQRNLARFENPRIYKMLSNSPILTDELKAAIEAGRTTLEKVTASQRSKTVDVKTGELVPVVDRRNKKPVFHLHGFSTTDIPHADVDDRVYSDAEEA